MAKNHIQFIELTIDLALRFALLPYTRLRPTAGRLGNESLVGPPRRANVVGSSSPLVRAVQTRDT